MEETPRHPVDGTPLKSHEYVNNDAGRHHAPAEEKNEELLPEKETESKPANSYEDKTKAPEKQKTADEPKKGRKVAEKKPLEPVSGDPDPKVDQSIIQDPKPLSEVTEKGQEITSDTVSSTSESASVHAETTVSSPVDETVSGQAPPQL